MNEYERPKGERFSLVYGQRGDPLPDSNTMRFRVAKLIERNENKEYLNRINSVTRSRESYYSDRKLQTAIEEELGSPFKARVSGEVQNTWPALYRRLEINQVLDSITILYSVMRGYGRGGSFVADVQRVFQEENLAYEFDEYGGAHPAIDVTYRTSMSATLCGLDEPKHTASKAYIEQIDGHLISSPPDYKQAIRSVFSALENTFKMMYEDTHQLNAKLAKDKLYRDIQSIYAKQDTVIRASQKNINAFSQWIDSAHFYRHEQGQPEPNQPSEELAILIISEGLAFLRWLIVIDNKRS